MASKGQTSAGLLVFRRHDHLEILLAHPGGPFWAGKDEGAWSIPKGLVESDDLIACARREFTEETGLTVEGEPISLGSVKQKSGKTVHAFAIEAALDLARFSSNHFEIEWPPRSGRRQSFPEVDRIAYFDTATAAQKILAYQRPFIAELERKLGIS